MSLGDFDAVTAVLVIPAATAALLAVLPGYRLTSRLNVLATFLTLVAALSLLVVRPRPGIYLLVDDTNIVYEHWVTRERRIASLICDRPVFILRLSDSELMPTRDAFRLEPFMTVRVAAGGPSASVERPIYRVEPIDLAACGS